MKVGPVKIVEHSSTDLRVVLVRTGEVIRKLTDRSQAESYVRGWNQLESKQ
jgi:hypothetical protein